MKFFKYILIAVAPLAFALSVNAQSVSQPAAAKPVVTEANSASGKITVTVTDLPGGKKRVDVAMETNKSSSIDTIRDAIAAAAKAIPEAKPAFSALLSSIESSMKSPSQPADGKFVFAASVEVKSDKSIALEADTTIGQQKISAKTNTVVADNGVATTSGVINVENSVTGEVASNAIDLRTNADGVNIGVVGDSSVASASLDDHLKQVVNNYPLNKYGERSFGDKVETSSKDSIMSEDEDPIYQLPDPTIASSGESSRR